MKLRPFLALGLPLLATARAVHAGASLYVDDAGTTPPGHCQLESWTRSYAPGQEWSAVPACTRGGVEYSLGVSSYDRPHDLLLTPGIKRTLRDPDGQAWGAAISLVAAWDVTQRRLEGWNLTVPVTLAVDAQGRTLLHADLGWSKLRGAAGALAGGLALEHRLSGQWSVLAELYADGSGEMDRQLGLRRALDATASLDLLAGCASGRRPGRWFTLGLNMALPD
ncbi:MAG TPA: hypothetical protein VGU65_09795 [Frateuria sp.]|uniref:hypothetical protein n=1 Tax=Frateuria sp. TaxID=2211372 RepID=UPI002DF17C34|nr:hypothetical protein [Frateuria sp.]